jgi:hypothetical protein
MLEHNFLSLRLEYSKNISPLAQQGCYTLMHIHSQWLFIAGINIMVKLTQCVTLRAAEIPSDLLQLIVCYSTSLLFKRFLFASQCLQTQIAIFFNLFFPLN